ncbi:MAG: hypothetical protein ABI693_00940 [Bryobacteraceae bacterium]
MFSLFDLPALHDTRIHVVDVGAMAIDEDIYAPLERAGRATVLGFEPVPEECANLNANARPGHRYVPQAVGDGRTRTLHLCNYSMTSSLYEPESDLLNLLPRPRRAGAGSRHSGAEDRSPRRYSRSPRG